MNSALQPQLLKLEEVLDETVKAGTTFQNELKSSILLRCVDGQLKSYLSLTIGDNVQYSTLREQVLQLIESKMPKEKVRRARMTIKRAKVKMPKAKESKEKDIRRKKKFLRVSIHLWCMHIHQRPRVTEALGLSSRAQPEPNVSGAQCETREAESSCCLVAVSFMNKWFLTPLLKQLRARNKTKIAEPVGVKQWWLLHC